MALRDYYRCQQCDAKVVYGPDRSDEDWEPFLLCRACLAKLRADNKALLDAAKKLLSGITACHYCGADLIPERRAAHCEDCPSGCESHDAPDCVQLSELVDSLRAAIEHSEPQ